MIGRAQGVGPRWRRERARQRNRDEREPSRCDQWREVPQPNGTARVVGGQRQRDAERQRDDLCLGRRALRHPEPVDQHGQRADRGKRAQPAGREREDNEHRRDHEHEVVFVEKRYGERQQGHRDRGGERRLVTQAKREISGAERDQRCDGGRDADRGRVRETERRRHRGQRVLDRDEALGVTVGRQIAQV